jgi:predicted hydrolase (HD superfamily)
MTHQEAYNLLTKYLHNKNLLKHSLAAEAAMKDLYTHLTPPSDQNPADEEKWGITGLLHDIDYEIAQKQNLLHKHGILLFERGELDLPEDIAHAIKAHNFENTGVHPQSLMDWSIVAADQLTGLIVAAALVHPDKKLAPLTPETVLKRFKEKSFAKGANRQSILHCEPKLNIPLKEFIQITLSSMQSIHKSLDL